MLWNKIVTRLIIPYFVFAAYFIFRQLEMGVAMCDCFENYGVAIVIAMVIVFFIGSVWKSYLMRKSNKEWKFFYTFFIVTSFLIIFYSIMEIGNRFYVPSGF